MFGETRITDPADTAHGALMEGLVQATEALHTASDTLRQTLLSDKAVKLRGCRYAPLRQGLTFGSGGSGSRQVFASSACQWFGYMLTETTGINPLVVAIGDGDNSGDDEVGRVTILAGTTALVRWQVGVGMSRGLVLTAVNGTGVVTGSVFLQ